MNEVLKKFDRETGWVATAVLGSVIFAATIVAVQLREHQRDPNNLPAKAIEVGIYQPLSSLIQTVERQPFTPGISLDSDVGHQNVRANTDTSILTTRKTPAVAKAPKTSAEEPKPSKRLRIVDVRKRLLELWHQSLVRDERRTWTLFQSSDKGRK